MLKSFFLPGLLWGAFFFLSSCSQEPLQDPHKHEDGAYKTTLVTGRFEGFPDYEEWVVYLTGFNYRSVAYKVEMDGAFHIKAVNIQPGLYLLHFGKKNQRNLGSMKVRVEAIRTHLGIIRSDI